METLVQRGSRGKVLIIEGSAGNRAARRLLTKALEGSEIAFADAKDALTEAERTVPEVILIDAMMPGMDGYALCRRLKSHALTRDVPYDFLSLEFETNALQAKVNDLLLQRSVLRSFREVVASAHLTDPAASSEFTENERRVLESGGFPFDRPLDPAPIAERALAFESMLGSSLTTGQASKKLRVQPSRIRQRLLARPPVLYGIRSGNAWRLPAFQFSRKGLIPNIDKVIARLAPGLDPVALERWFRAPNLELDDGELPVSPLAWLAEGKAWQRVAKLAEEL